MRRKIPGRVAFLLLLPAIIAAGGTGKGSKVADGEPRVISGMSIMGNDETTKSLYIVPWKSSEVGKEITFASGILNEELTPVDKDEFIRQLDLFRTSNSN